MDSTDCPSRLVGRDSQPRSDLWAEALEARRGEALAVQSEEVSDRYTKYLTGCGEPFRTGYTDVCQFTLVKA